MNKTPSSTLRDPLRFAVLAADLTLFTLRDGELCVRLMYIERPPHFDHVPGLPGGLIHAEESAEESARRICAEKGNVAASNVYFEQLYTFSRVDRDPRNRVVAVGYTGLVAFDHLTAEERSNSESAFWCPVRQAKRLAFDHDEILATAVARLRSRVHYTTLISKLMPKTFTLTELETAYELVLGTDLDKRNFRKKILKLDILEETGTKRSDGAFRPAALYRFKGTKVRDIEVL